MSVIDQDTAAPLTGAQILARLNAVGLAFVDSSFSIIGSSDATKIAKFEVDGFTTGTTRTFTLPNVTSTLAVLGLAQTFTTAQTFSAPLTVTDATASTTSGTGAVIITGGVGVGGAINAAGIIKSFDSVRAFKNGSDSIGSGANFYLANTAGTIALAQQLSGSNHLDWWYFNGSVWAQIMRLTTAGALLVNTTTDDAIHKLQVAGPATSTGQSWAYNAYSGSVSLTTANGLCVYTGSGTSHSFTLPAASAYGSAKAGRLMVKNQGTVGAMYVVPAGADTIFTGVSGVVAVGLSIGESREFETNGTGVWSMV